MVAGQMSSNQTMLQPFRHRMHLQHSFWQQIGILFWFYRTNYYCLNTRAHKLVCVCVWCTNSESKKKQHKHTHENYMHSKPCNLVLNDILGQKWKMRVIEMSWNFTYTHNEQFGSLINFSRFGFNFCKLFKTLERGW